MEFPAFLFGDEESVIARADAEGAAWLGAWRRTGALSVGALREIRPGELVLVHHGTLDPFTPRWMLCGVEFALSAVVHELDEAERAAFSELLAATPWGALSACTRMRAPNTVEVVTRRARSLLAMWEPLATLRYIGGPQKLPDIVTFPGLNQDSIDLDALVAELFAGPLALWGPDLGSARLRLDAALTAMALASPEQARDKVLTRMLALARQNPRTKNSAATDPAAIARWVDNLSADERSALTPGVNSDLLSELYALSRWARSMN